MKIVINAATIQNGGGLQVTCSFINQTLFDQSHSFFYIISNKVHTRLISENIIIKDNVLILSDSPANILKRKSLNRIVNKELLKFDPDIVYSIGAPSYFNFKYKEVLRLTNPWITHPNKYAFKLLSVTNKVKVYLKSEIQRKFWVRKVKYFITQTKTSKVGILKISGVNNSHVEVIPNVISPRLIGKSSLKESHCNHEELRVFCLAAGHNHKNLDIIPYVIKEIKEKYGFSKIKFVLTIDQDSKVNKLIQETANSLDVKSNVENLGPIDYTECINQYNACDCVFVPTVLETFSATHIESMYFRKPVITTDLPFCRDVCEDAALYFEPFDYKEAARLIFEIGGGRNNIDKELLIEKGSQIVSKYLDYDKYYLDTIRFLIKCNDNE